jgi:hypothetical protein
MPRVVASEVRATLPSYTTLTDPQLSAAIAAATCLVDQVAGGCGEDLTTDCLKQVELYLSAHYAAATENTLSLSSESDPCGGGKAVYGFQFGEGVKGTPFGQMANTLSGGCLAEFDKQPVNLFSIGTHGDDLI